MDTTPEAPGPAAELAEITRLYDSVPCPDDDDAAVWVAIKIARRARSVGRKAERAALRGAA